MENSNNGPTLLVSQTDHRTRGFSSLPSVLLQMIMEQLSIGEMMALARCDQFCLRELNRKDALVWKKRLFEVDKESIYWNIVNHPGSIIRNHAPLLWRTYPYAFAKHYLVEREFEFIQNYLPKVHILQVRTYSSALTTLLYSPTMQRSLRGLFLYGMLGGGAVTDELFLAIAALPNLQTLKISKDWTATSGDRSGISNRYAFNHLSTCKNLTSVSFFPSVIERSQSDYLSDFLRYLSSPLKYLRLMSDPGVRNSICWATDIHPTMMKNTDLNGIQKLSFYSVSFSSSGKSADPLTEMFLTLTQLWSLECRSCWDTIRLLNASSISSSLRRVIWSGCIPKLTARTPKASDLITFFDTPPLLMESFIIAVTDESIVGQLEQVRRISPKIVVVLETGDLDEDWTTRLDRMNQTLEMI